MFTLDVMYTSKLKILRIKKREYRDGIKRKETRLELGTHNVGKACGAYITKGCKANSYTLLYTPL